MKQRGSPSLIPEYRKKTWSPIDVSAGNDLASRQRAAPPCIYVDRQDVSEKYPHPLPKKGNRTKSTPVQKKTAIFLRYL